MIKSRDKLAFLVMIYSISTLVTVFWSLGFWFVFDSSMERMISNDIVSGWLIFWYSVAFVIYAFFYYSIMKPHYEWVVRMVRAANE